MLLQVQPLVASVFRQVGLDVAHCQRLSASSWQVPAQSVVRECVVSQEDRFGKPVRMVNMDQTAVAFVQVLDSTYADGDERNRGTVRNPSMRLRMSTLQVLLCNDPSVPRCRGSGTEPVRPSGQGSVAAERVDGHQLVPPVDSERVQAMGERCLSRPRAHRLVGQCDASARFRRDPENEETVFCATVRAEEHDGALATLGRWRCEQHLQGLAAGHHGRGEMGRWESLSQRAEPAAHLVGEHAWQELMGAKYKTHVAKAFKTCKDHLK